MRRIAMLIAALAAMTAVALPAGASAARLESSGKPVQVGTHITMQGTSWNFKSVYWGAGQCERVEFPEEVIKNSGGTAEVIQRGPGTATNCFMNGRRLIETPELRKLKL